MPGFWETFGAPTLPYTSYGFFVLVYISRLPHPSDVNNFFCNEFSKWKMIANFSKPPPWKQFDFCLFGTQWCRTVCPLPRVGWWAPRPPSPSDLPDRSMPTAAKETFNVTRPPVSLFCPINSFANFLLPNILWSIYGINTKCKPRVNQGLPTHISVKPIPEETHTHPFPSSPSRIDCVW